ncbi:hypothetical protein Tco_0620356 [Tanacetum coccineum]
MSDEDGVPETIFGSSSLVPNHRDEDKDAAHSDDPFGLYDLLKNKKGTTNHVPSPSLSEGVKWLLILDVMEISFVLAQVNGHSMERLREGFRKHQSKKPERKMLLDEFPTINTSRRRYGLKENGPMKLSVLSTLKELLSCFWTSNKYP